MSDLRLFNARVRWASLAMVSVLSTLVSVGIWQSSWAEVTEPKTVERKVTQIVTGMMKQRHLLRHPLNDEISQRAFKLFIDGLDPLKSYFYQQDIDDFKQYETKLDDMLSQENTKFANLVFQRFLQRVDERVAVIDELLAQSFDFTVDEEMITEPDLLQLSEGRGRSPRSLAATNQIRFVGAQVRQVGCQRHEDRATSEGRGNTGEGSP